MAHYARSCEQDAMKLLVHWLTALCQKLLSVRITN